MKKLWNDGWSFLKTPVGTTLEEARGRLGEFGAVDIPHDWLIYDAENLYENGIGWYGKHFTWQAEPDKFASVVFEGVYMDSVIYVNGRKAGEWKYGYSAFEVELTPFLRAGENEILVSVCFQSPNSRWYSGAGIYRDVWFVEKEAVSLARDGIYVSTRRRGQDFVLRVETEVEVRGQAEDEPLKESGELAWRLEYRLYGQRTACGQAQDEEQDPSGQTASGGAGAEIPIQLLSQQGNIREYLVPAPGLWDVENPALYTLKAFLYKGKEAGGELWQQEEVTVGFREISFDPEKGFFLNGRNLKLNGVCEHHDLGALGAVFNRCAMKRKFRILKEMGVNAVRGSHNMMAPGFLELADEMGILLISEAFDMWEKPKTEYDYARFFADWHEKDVRSWVRRDRNHPSVILWSIGNEIYDTHADGHGREITARLKELVEQLDPEKNAAVTLASNYMPWENAKRCADLVEIAGYNYSERYYEQHHKEHPDWVIYGSETSSIVQSRGVYHFPLRAGILSEDDEQCSALGNSITSWGARSMEDCIVLDRDLPFSMGQFIWTGFDYIGEPTPYHTKNSYFGQIDTAGFPKDSYYVWQSAWTDYRKSPMVHVFPYWDFNPGQRIDVRVCSNAPEVELFLNGISCGRKRLSHGPGSGREILADYQLEYQPGVLTAVAYDGEGRELARDERRSFGNSASIVIRPENTVAAADGRDLFFLEIGTADALENPVENACDRVTVEVTGAGRLVGIDNGDSTDYDSYKGTSKRLFNGKLLAMVQSNPVPGEILIRVSGEGLKPAQVRCRTLQTACTPAGNADAEAGGAACGVTASEANKPMPVVTGNEGDIPVRKILLTAEEGRTFTPKKKVLTAFARIEPENATDRELIFGAVDENGVPSNLVTVTACGNRVSMEAKGDGSFYLRCMSKSGTGRIRLISQLEFSISGLGQAYLDPYDFISGSQYTYVRGNAGSGNERGIATARDGETVVAFGNIDFGKVGSDEITVPIFALDGDEYPIQIWEGIPGEEKSSLLAAVVYHKPSIWNVYQPDTWKLDRMLRGITTVSFLLRQKVHIKGFSFKKYEKAYMQLKAVEADAIYGDSFRRTEENVEEIGNNVTLLYEDMNFGEEGASALAICGRAPHADNTIHVRFWDGQTESKQIVEFTKSGEYTEKSFPLEPVKGNCQVSFVFMPGSCFDFKWFCFQK